MRKRNFKEIFEKLLKEKLTEGELKELIPNLIKAPKRISVYDAMAMVQLGKALSGDIKSFELIRSIVSSGEAWDEEGEGVVKVMITDE